MRYCTEDGVSPSGTAALIMLNHAPLPQLDEMGGELMVAEDTTLGRPLICSNALSKNDKTASPLGYEASGRLTRNVRTFAVRTPGVVWAVDDDVPLTNVHTMEEYVWRSVAAPRFRTMLLGSLAGIALLLAIVGIYGVLSYSVAQRGREMAIRIALGAPGARVVQLVMRQGMTLVLSGVVVGLGAAFALTRLLSSFLFDVEATDPAVFALLPLLLVAVALVAVYLPARRAMQADPVEALKHE